MVWQHPVIWQLIGALLAVYAMRMVVAALLRMARRYLPLPGLYAITLVLLVLGEIALRLPRGGVSQKSLLLLFAATLFWLVADVLRHNNPLSGFKSVE